jgi:sulfatase maturation enzyme AslB (radical SAM superfamily)
MSKLILKFNLPEEETEANFALKGGEYFLVLHDFYQKLRHITKYGNNPFNGKMASEQEILLAEQIREYLNEKDFKDL